ncbi:MAG: YqzL family protein [Clostridia bacterium]|nr:YqzL family protein [Clostridia bacterium]
MLDVKELCWRLFEETGEIKYYMLYKSLEDGDGLYF